jgi:hypothetical protein
VNCFDLEPVLIALRPIRRVGPLRDDAFPVQLGGMLEHLLTVAGEVFRVDYGQLDIILPKKIEKQLLAFDLREFAKVAVPPEQIKRVVDEPTLPACGQLCLQFGEISPAFMDDHNLAIDNGLARDGECTSNLSEALGPIQPVAGEDLLPTPAEMHLNAVAVVLDLVEPQVALGRLSL